MYKKIDLDNGVRIILNHMSGMESAAVGLWLATGSRNEERHCSGISHFLEHMIFKGTPTRSSRRIKEEIEGRGGSLNGFTSEEITCYLARVSGRHIGTALNVLSDMVLHAHIKEKDIERERTVIIEEIKMYQDLPHYRVHDILSELMWPLHPLGLPVAGDLKSVSSITRNDLLDYKGANYIPKNMVVVLCGNLDHDASLTRLNKLFGGRTKRSPVALREFNNRQSCPRLRILYKKTEQSHLSMGIHTTGRMHKDRFAISLLHIILGANMSSRLFENIREKKGLAYEIGTEVKRYRDTGAFIVNAGVEHKKVKEVTALIIKELKEIKARAISGQELKRAKEFFKVQLLLALEDTMDHMLWLGERVLETDRLPDKRAFIKKVESVSIADLQRVAKRIFNKNNLNVAIVGPVRDGQKIKLERELDF